MTYAEALATREAAAQAHTDFCNDVYFPARHKFLVTHEIDADEYLPIREQERALVAAFDEADFALMAMDEPEEVEEAGEQLGLDL